MSLLVMWNTWIWFWRSEKIDPFALSLSRQYWRMNSQGVYTSAILNNSKSTLFSSTLVFSSCSTTNVRQYVTNLQAGGFRSFFGCAVRSSFEPFGVPATKIGATLNPTIFSFGWSSSSGASLRSSDSINLGDALNEYRGTQLSTFLLSIFNSFNFSSRDSRSNVGDYDLLDRCSLISGTVKPFSDYWCVAKILRTSFSSIEGNSSKILLNYWSLSSVT